MHKPPGTGDQVQKSWLRRRSGAEGSRTLGLCSAIAALSQLSYRPRLIHFHKTRPCDKGFGEKPRDIRPWAFRLFAPPAFVNGYFRNDLVHEDVVRSHGDFGE